MAGLVGGLVDLRWGAGLACLASGWAPVVRATLIQRDTPEDQRATVASAASTVDLAVRILAFWGGRGFFGGGRG